MRGQPGRKEKEKVPLPWRDTTEKLRRPERVAVLAFVIGSVILDIAGFVMFPDTNVTQRLLSVAVTSTLALYIWSPWLATSLLGALVALSFVAGSAIDTLIAAAVAAFLVLRLATTPLIIAYAGGVFVASALLASGLGSPDAEAGNITVFLIVATIAGAVGLALRTAYARGHRLELELADQEERERQAVQAERRWIAGELHDSIAHHLTVISLHTQLLDDESARPGSQDAIKDAVRKALSDLRFVINLAEEAPHGADIPVGDLASAINEARDEFEAAGHPTSFLGNPADEGIPRGVEIILARIIRESATNILKYAGPGEVCGTLDVGSDLISLMIKSPIPQVSRRGISSTGTGLNRMAERVLGVSGDFSAGPVGDHWVVEAHVPIAPSLQRESH